MPRTLTKAVKQQYHNHAEIVVDNLNLVTKNETMFLYKQCTGKKLSQNANNLVDRFIRIGINFVLSARAPLVNQKG